MQSWSRLTRRIINRLPSRRLPILNELNLPIPIAASFTNRPWTANPLRTMSAQPNNITINGDLNNTQVLRKTISLPPDPEYFTTTLAIPTNEDDTTLRNQYRPFLLPDLISSTDWISKLELSTVLKMSEAELVKTSGNRIKVLVLYGSLRRRSYSRLLAFECSRILSRLGCDVRVYNPESLPVKDDVQHNHPKVQELRELSKWSDGHLWVCPEQHGNLTAVFKNQIDWIPLSTGSVRPTQNRTLAIAQVSGGSQSFNTVNSLRILGRWMRMFVIPNQSSLPKAYTQFTDAFVDENGEGYVEAEGGSRLMPSGNRDRVVDCMEEFVKFTIFMRGGFEVFGDRFSERVERREKLEREETEAARKKAGEEGNVKSLNGAVGVVNGVDVGGI